MKQKVRHAALRVTRWLGSQTAWRLLLGLFLLEALWFVFSARYPMAFDENYHFGLIKLHADQWLPFFTAQPHNAAVFGAVVRDPSYLYHWLMSFPYRLISLFVHSQPVQVILLRLINVALFGLGIELYRRILRQIGASAALTTSVLAVFVLIPVVPFLAAHINYDNLFFVAVALAILLAVRSLESFRVKRIDAATTLLLLAVLCLSSLIKYPFLPIAVITGLFLLWRAWRGGLLSKAGWQSAVTGFRKLQRWQSVLLVVLVVISAGLFTERYIDNLATYHDPVPACDAVISQDECAQYGPYGRDRIFAQEKPAAFHPSLGWYIGQWFYGMWYRLFFAINYDYATSPPLFVISRLAIGLAVMLGVGVTLRFRPLFRAQPVRQLILWLMAGYTLVLFVDGFSSYAKTAQPVAINGRYIIPFLPFVFALGGIAWSQLLRGKWAALKPVAASLVIATFLLQGGGTMTYIIRSGDVWLWNNGTVRSVNRIVRSAAWPFIIDKDHT